MPRPKKRTRPGPKPRGKTSASVLSIRINEDERRRWDAFATRQNLTLSAALREAYETAIARGSTR